VTQEEVTEWPADWTRVIGRAVKRAREARKLSGEALSQRCTALGYPIARTVIANLENGRRPGANVHEVVILARALDVAPLDLIFPAAWMDQVPLLPDAEHDVLAAAQWFAGAGPFPRESWTGSELGPYRAHDERLREYRFRVDAAANAERTNLDADVVRHNREMAEQALIALRAVRDAIRVRGHRMPALPAEIEDVAPGQDGA
jgi:transcriptional regulator with XRE-family HTH domain